MSAIGIGLYASQAPPADSTQDAVAADPVRVVVDLTEAGEKRLRSIIGEQCPADAIPGIATDSDDDSFTVVIGDDLCNAAVLNVADAVGTVKNTENVCDPGCVRRPPRNDGSGPEHIERIVPRS